MRSWRRLLALAAVLLGGLGLSACGVPVGGSPATLAPKDVPYGLLKKAAPSTPTTDLPTPFTVPIYFVAPTGHLVIEERDVPVPYRLDSDAGLVAILQYLIVGPTTAEAQAGVQGAIPAQTKVLPGTAITGTVATVNLSANFGQLSGQTQIQAIAQVAFTVIGALPGLTGVSFEIEGQHAQVPTPPAGALVNVATRTLYRSLAPLP